MPQNTVWSSNERRVAAIAYLRTTQDCVVGKDQTGKEFWDKIIERIAQIEPQGENESRSPSAIKSFIAAKILPDVQKFNVSLTKVLSAKPSGINDQQIINMAVAVHLNKTAGRDYEFRDFDPTKWPNYSAWLVLKNIRKFAPPSPPTDLSPPAMDPVVQTNLEPIQNNEELSSLAAIPVPTAESVLTTTTTTMFTPIGQKAAKRAFYANKKMATDEVKRVEEVKRIRLAMDERNKLIGERNATQERSKRIEELKTLLKITKNVDPTLYETTRKELVALVTAPSVTVTCTSKSTGTSSSIGSVSSDDSRNNDVSNDIGTDHISVQNNGESNENNGENSSL